MRFKGIDFYPTSAVRGLQGVHHAAVHPRYSDGSRVGYVVFGRKVRKPTLQSIERDGQHYEVIRGGYSRTDLLYGDDGRTYCMKDGHCYQTRVSR